MSNLITYLASIVGAAIGGAKGAAVGFVILLLGQGLGKTTTDIPLKGAAIGASLFSLIGLFAKGDDDSVLMMALWGTVLGIFCGSFIRIYKEEPENRINWIGGIIGGILSFSSAEALAFCVGSQRLSLILTFSLPAIFGLVFKIISEIAKSDFNIDHVIHTKLRIYRFLLFITLFSVMLAFLFALFTIKNLAELFMASLSCSINLCICIVFSISRPQERILKIILFLLTAIVIPVVIYLQPNI